MLLAGGGMTAQNVCQVQIRSGFESSCIMTIEKDQFLDEMSEKILACQESEVVYTATASSAAAGISVQSVAWTVIGATSHIASGNSVTVHWGSGDAGQVTADVTMSDGSACTATKDIALMEKPTIGATTVPAYEDNGGTYTIRVCKGEDIYFTDASSTGNSDIVGHYWETSLGDVASTKDFVVRGVVQDMAVTHRVYNNCGCYEEEAYQVELLGGEPLQLECYGTVCEGATVTYKVASAPCDKYMWAVDGGRIVAGQGTPTPTIVWDDPRNGYGVIGLDGNLCGNNYCPKLLSLKVPIICGNVEIKGQATACVGDAVLYSVPLYGSTEYRWTVSPGVGQHPRNGANEMVLQFDTPGTYTLKVEYRCDFLDCGWYASATKTVAVRPRLKISGDDRICLSNAANLSLTPSVVADWTAYDDATGSVVHTSTGTTFNHVFTSSGKYRIVASNGNYCEDAAFLLEVKAPPAAPTAGDIANDTTVYACPYGSILLTGNAENATCNLIWEPVNANGSPAEVTGDSATITYNGTVCNIHVYNYDRRLRCRSAQPYIQKVQPFALAPLAIPSNITVCPGATIDLTTGQVPYQEGVLYKWMLQHDMQRCASVIGDKLSNSVAIVINNVDSLVTPYSFDVQLIRGFCKTTHTDVITITVAEMPSTSIQIAPVQTVCGGVPVTLQLSGNANGHVLWDMGDGTQNIHGNPVTHVFDGGTYHVKAYYLGDYDFCTNTNFASTAIKTIHVNASPNVGDVYYDDYHARVELHPPLTGTGYAYSWTGPGGATSTQDHIAYLGPGSYCCTVTNTATQCSTTVCDYIEHYGNCLPLSFVTNPSFAANLCQGIMEYEVVNPPAPVHWAVTFGRGEASIVIQGVNNAHATIQFHDVGTHSVEAVYEHDGQCHRGVTHTTIDFIPDFSLENVCTGVVIHNKSKSVSPCMINYTYSGTSTGSGSFPASQTTYMVPLNPSPHGTYTFHFAASCADPTCTTSVSTNFLPQGSTLTLTSGNTNYPDRTCDNTPIVLTANYKDATGAIIPGAVKSVDWDFGDSSSLHTLNNEVTHTYTYRIGCSNNYILSATCMNKNGCPASTSMNITSHKDDLLSGDLDQSPTSSLCPGEPILLAYNAPTTTTSYISYYWNGSAVSTGADAITVFNRGTYTVVAQNRNYCRDDAERFVPFLNAPDASISAGGDKYCVGDVVELYGGDGSSTDTYAWTLLSSPTGANINVSPNMTSPDISFSATKPGTYAFELTVSNDSCSSTSPTMFIHVNPTPPEPSLGFGPNRCIDNPPVNLIESSSPAKPVFWNNGSFGTTANYFNAGFAEAYYYDTATGCMSDVARIKIDPAPDFDALLTGCYEKCREFFPYDLHVHGLTGGAETIDWEWFRNAASVDGAVGDYHLSPLVLNLPALGSYYLDVKYAANTCNVKSPSLTITAKDTCDCDDMSVTTEILNMQTLGCKASFDVRFTVCYGPGHKGCISAVSSVMDGHGIDITGMTALPVIVPDNSCRTVDMSFILNDLSAASIPFTIYDGCNRCAKEVSIPVEWKVECQERMLLGGLGVQQDLSSSYVAYLTMDFDLPNPVATVFSFWSEPSQVLNYYFDGIVHLTSLVMFDIPTLSQLAAEGKEVCFYALTCEDDVVCLHSFCIPAAELLAQLFREIPRKSQQEVPKTDGDGSRTLAEDTPRLVPNPAWSSFRVEGMDANEIAEIMAMDMNGRTIKTAKDTDRMGIGSFARGSYIVRVICANGEAYYLKLIKD